MIPAQKKNWLYLSALLGLGLITTPASAFDRFWLSGDYATGSDDYQGYEATLDIPLVNRAGRVGDIAGQAYGYMDDFLAKSGYKAGGYSGGALWLNYDISLFTFLIRGDFVPDGGAFYSAKGTLGIKANLIPGTTDGFYLEPGIDFSRSYYSDSTVPTLDGSTWDDFANGIAPHLDFSIPQIGWLNFYFDQSVYDTAIPSNARPALLASELGNEWVLGYPDWTYSITFSHAFSLGTPGHDWVTLTPSLYDAQAAYENTNIQLQSIGLNLTMEMNYQNGRGGFALWTGFEMLQPSVGTGNSRSFFNLGARF
jgi:hypothetical protein